MFYLILGLVLFFLPHALLTFLPEFRKNAVARIGMIPWKVVYSLVSLFGLIMVTWGWAELRPGAPVVYQPFSWGRDVTYIFVLFAFILFAIPRSKPGRILVTLKHPMLWGTFFWSAGHLMANGDLAAVILFGSFLAYSIIGRIGAYRRGDPQPVFVSYRSDIIAIIAGTVLYLAFALWAHGYFFGISPFQPRLS